MYFFLIMSKFINQLSIKKEIVLTKSQNLENFVSFLSFNHNVKKNKT